MYEYSHGELEIRLLVLDKIEKFYCAMCARAVKVAILVNKQTVRIIEIFHVLRTIMFLKKCIFIFIIYIFRKNLRGRNTVFNGDYFGPKLKTFFNSYNKS